MRVDQNLWRYYFLLIRQDNLQKCNITIKSGHLFYLKKQYVIITLKTAFLRIFEDV